MTRPLRSTTITAASSLLRSSPPLSGASVLSASRLVPLAPSPLASPARFSRSVQVAHRHYRPAANETALDLRRAVSTEVVHWLGAPCGPALLVTQDPPAGPRGYRFHIPPLCDSGALARASPNHKTLNRASTHCGVRSRRLTASCR